MFRSIVASAAVMALAVGASAQTQQMNAGRIHQSVTPTYGTYSLTSGFQVNNQAYRYGPATIFDNTNGAEYYFSTLGATEEWIDECAFAATDLDGNEQINGISWEYCSMVPDVAGTAITTELRFYNDTVLGAGPTGWLDLVAGTNQNAQCGYLIAGLPGDLSGTFAINCWGVTVDLSAGFECSVPQELTPGGFTELNGIGWMYYDAGSLGLTGPVLDSTWSFGGAGTAIPGYGSQDYFELFDLSLGLGAEYVGAFFFGGGSKLQGSFQTVLYGDGILDTDVVNADVPGTGDVLVLSSDVEFRPGNSVTWSLNAPGTAGLTYAMLVGTAGSSAGFGSIAGPGTTLLVNPGSILTPPTPFIMSGATPAVSTPPLPALPPTVYAQAMGFSGGVAPGNATEASNALKHDN